MKTTALTLTLSLMMSSPLIAIEPSTPPTTSTTSVEIPVAVETGGVEAMRMAAPVEGQDPRTVPVQWLDHTGKLIDAGYMIWAKPGKPVPCDGHLHGKECAQCTRRVCVGRQPEGKAGLDIPFIRMMGDVPLNILWWQHRDGEQK